MLNWQSLSLAGKSHVNIIHLIPVKRDGAVFFLEPLGLGYKGCADVKLCIFIA